MEYNAKPTIKAKIISVPPTIRIPGRESIDQSVKIIEKEVSGGGGNEPVDMSISATLAGKGLLGAIDFLEPAFHTERDDGSNVTYVSITMRAAFDGLMVLLVMHRSDIISAIDGWDYICTSSKETETNQRVSVWTKKAIRGTEYSVTARQNSSTVMSPMLWCIKNAESITLTSDSGAIPQTPYVVPARVGGNKRLIVGTNCYAYSDGTTYNCVISYTDGEIMEANSNRLNAFYDYGETSSDLSFDAHDLYHSNSMVILTFDVIKGE